MTSALYEVLKTHIETLSDIKGVAYFNNQPNTPEAHFAVKTPCVYVEFSTFDAKGYATNPDTNQQLVRGLLNIRLHVRQDRVDQHKPLHLDILASLVAHMVQYKDDANGLSNMGIGQIQPDHDHDNVISHVIDYQAAYDMQLPVVPPTTVTEVALELNTDLIILDPDIRTGYID